MVDRGAWEVRTDRPDSLRTAAREAEPAAWISLHRIINVRQDVPDDIVLRTD